jgi:hypothetical protein
MTGGLETGALGVPLVTCVRSLQNNGLSSLDFRGARPRPRRKLAAKPVCTKEAEDELTSPITVRREFCCYNSIKGPYN